MNVEPRRERLGQHKKIKYEITVVSYGSETIQTLVCVWFLCDDSRILVRASAGSLKLCE